jgi:hypothetical protein
MRNLMSFERQWTDTRASATMSAEPFGRSVRSSPPTPDAGWPPSQRQLEAMLSTLQARPVCLRCAAFAVLDSPDKVVARALGAYDSDDQQLFEQP